MPRPDFILTGDPPFLHVCHAIGARYEIEPIAASSVAYHRANTVH